MAVAFGGGQRLAAVRSRVHPGRYTIQVDMPVVGLAVAGEHLPVGSAAASAARRSGCRANDKPPVAGY